jgi:NADH:ubiquinone oxidoreductase subunit 5 (subunit L)/multisubunit Na+/H+ antiporter MnhA subunit
MPNETEGLHGGWIAEMVNDSPAAAGVPGAVLDSAHGVNIGHEVAHGDILGMDPHKAMYYISAIVGFIGIGIAFFIHLLSRPTADKLRSTMLSNKATRWLPTAMENKWYVDEFYIAVIRSPLWILGKIFSLFDRYFIDGALVNGIAAIPRVIARWFSPLHNGAIQSYAISMFGGALLIALLMLFMPEILAFMQTLSPDTANEQTIATLGGGK